MSTGFWARSQEVLKMNNYLGIDTSNYTTSAAIFDGEAVRQEKMLLPVGEGEKGLRQSKALFHHVKQLPTVLDRLFNGENITAIGVSSRPRNIEGSYMPCFLAGEGLAESLGSFARLPVYKTSHQVGHILAALYSCKRLDLISDKKPFIAFHLSGGTTDCLLVEPSKDEVIKCTAVASSLDLKAGQAVDRVGLMLGLKFPCGAELENLALRSQRKFSIKPTLKGGSCCLSGLENICKKMLDSGEPSCDVALYCLKYIEAALIAMTEFALNEYGYLPLVYAGGVMSDSIIRESVRKKFSAEFAEPAFSADNAAGLAVYAYIKDCFD